MKPLLISSGEPAGIGPDICLALSSSEIPLVVMGDLSVLKARAQALHFDIQFKTYQNQDKIVPKLGELTVLHIPRQADVKPGQIDEKNAPYVLDLLTQGVDRTLSREFSGFVTAPVHKGIINQAGFPFTGHTEFLAKRCKQDTVVMMLACEALKVALVTTHLPLSEVPGAITEALLTNIIEQIHQSLQIDFNISAPKVKVAGLNPHAGESGYLGREEIDTIIPALDKLRAKGMDIEGPLPADTMFANHHHSQTDIYVAMYHDQGLPVLKYAGFGQAVNITLGLPIIRTSVDHGTALDLAATGRANPGSLLSALKMAHEMAKNREKA